MGGDQQDSRFKQDSFSLEIDPELLNAALSAVDKRRRRPGPASDEPEEEQSTLSQDEITGSSAEPGDGDPAGPADDAVALLSPGEPEGDLPDELDLDLDLEIETHELSAPLSSPLPSGRAPAARAPDAAPSDGGDLQQRARKLQKQVADLEEAHKADAAELKKLRHEHTKLRAALQRAQERAAKAEETVANLTDTVQAAERVVARHKDAQRKAEDSLHHLQDRRRQEQADQKKHGHAPVILELLPVLDHLQMATAHASADPAVLMQGVNMVIAQFQAALQRLGVQRIEAAAGGAFLPEVHEAMLFTPSADVPPGRILQEITSGYTLNGRLLRAARVSLAAAAPASSGAAADPPPSQGAPPQAPPEAAPADPEGPPEGRSTPAEEPSEEDDLPAASAADDGNPFKIPPHLAYLEE